MSRSKRRDIALAAALTNQEQLARLGRAARDARRRRRLTLRHLSDRAGVSASAISRMERGKGGGSTVDSWQRVATALGRPLRIDLAPETIDFTADAGHLAIQELLLGLGRQLGYVPAFEMASRPTDPARSIDVRWRHDQRRLLIVLEAWNTIGDIGAGARSFDRKLADVEAFAIAIGAGRPHRVAGCWVVRATTRNRALLARYPEVFAARFPGSSERWIRALTLGTAPPELSGLVWCDVGATRLFAWRRRAA